MANKCDHCKKKLTGIFLEIDMTGRFNNSEDEEKELCIEDEGLTFCDGNCFTAYIDKFMKKCQEDINNNAGE
jgi:hypothetical protein